MASSNVVPIERFQRARDGFGLICRRWCGLHPRPFAIAVSGAAVFALCTVASSAAIRWVIDHVIVPRFDEGSVAAGTVLAGVGLIIGIGVVRAGGVVVRRTWAGKTQWRVAGTLSRGVIDRLVRQPMSWHARRPDGDLVARAGVDTDAAVSVLAPIPFATGTVLLIVVSAIWLLATDVVMGARRRRRVPDPDRAQHRLPEARRRLLRRRPGPPRRPVGRGPRELRRRAAGQGLRRRAARDRAAGGDRRPPARGAHRRRAPARHVRGAARRAAVDDQRRARRCSAPTASGAATSRSASCRASSTCSRCSCSRCA